MTAGKEIVTELVLTLYDNTVFFSEDIAQFVIDDSNDNNPVAVCTHIASDEYISYIISLSLFDRTLKLTSENIPIKQGMFDCVFQNALHILIEPVNFIRYRSGLIDYYSRKYSFRVDGQTLVPSFLPATLEYRVIDQENINPE